MKIIINQPRASYFVGGAEMISFDHAINLYKLGHEIFFITISPKSVGLNYSVQFKKFYKEYNDKIDIIEIEQDEKIKDIYEIEPGEDRCRWNIESIFYNQRLYEYFSRKSEVYDVIFSYYNLDAVFIPKNIILKNVLYLCGIPKLQNDFQGSFLSIYDRIVAISEDVKDAWLKYCKNGVSVVSTGVDCNRFSCRDVKMNNLETINLLFVGRLIKRKNIDKIIYAFEEIRKTINVKLEIVGDGPDRKRLESISNNVTFTGVVNDTEKYYRNADIFISPSEYGEGLQGTILESMSCGLTVVATNTKINKELLSNNRGVLIDTDIDAIVKGIKTAINSDRIKIANNCREYVLCKYDWKNKVKELMEVLR